MRPLPGGARTGPPEPPRASAALRSGVVTTTARPRPEQVQLAERVARQADLPRVPYDSSIRRTMERVGADHAVVVERADVKLLWAGGELRHHPGLAVYRVGVDQPSQFLAALRPRWGETTLDLTLGMGRDALLVADRTDQIVLGFERSPIISVLTALGLPRLARVKRFRDAAPRVRPVRGDGFRAMAELGRDRFDLVLLDPLFPQPVRGARDMEAIHLIEAAEPFDVEILRRATRIARRRVVLRWPASMPLPDLPFRAVLPALRGRYFYLSAEASRARRTRAR